jgi:hypothetical protein
MSIDRNRLVEIFEALGRIFTKPTTLCLIGSSPGIVSGQPDRQSPDIDVWYQQSAYDETQFREACREVGVLFDPRDELDPNAIYFQIIRAGTVRLPPDFEPETLGQYGNLTIAMPPPALLSAAKLARGNKYDVGDVVWWVKERALSMDEIRAAIGTLPDQSHREVASENVVLVELVVTAERKPK